MPSGQNRVIYNNLERALSTDQGTEQDVAATARQQQLRRAYSRASSGRRDYSTPGLDKCPTALPTSDYGTVHDCYGGLMVRPDNAAGLLIDGGAAGFLVPGWPGLGANDTPYVVVDSPGITDVTALPFTSNVSGSPRIDIVECQPFEDVTTTTTESRDILNPLTDAWAPAVVPKRAGAQLRFRIRVGTPNDGFPAIDQAWMPLAFIVVQSGASGFTQADVYDVRPLVDERTGQFGSGLVTSNPAVFAASSGEVFDRAVEPSNTTGGTTGWFRGEYNGYHVGGVIQRNTPSSLADFGAAGDSASFDTGVAANIVTGSPSAPSVTIGALSAICAVWPRGLGRCVRYSQAAAPAAAFPGQQTLTGRLPTGPNGILVLARSPVTTAKGGVLIYNLPPIFGTNAAASYPYPGLVVGWTQGTGSVALPMIGRGKRFDFSLTTAEVTACLGAWASSGTIPYTSSTLTMQLVAVGDMTNLNRGTTSENVPNTARSVTLMSFLNISCSATPSSLLPSVTAPKASWSTLASRNMYCEGGMTAWFGVDAGSATASLEQVFDIPMTKGSYPWIAGGMTTDVTRTLSAGGGGNTVDVESLNWLVTGWDEW